MSALRPDRGEVEAYVDLVYGGASGFSICGFGTPVLLGGKYKHDPFRQRSFRFPQQRGLMLDAIGAAAAGEEDVFVTPLLRDRPSRQKGKSQPVAGRLVWLDVDEWSTELEQELRRLGLPCHVVDSGGIGDRRHVYVDVGRRLPGPAVADYADRLAKALGTDTSGGNNKFLRPPGTFNHKARLLKGEAAREVRRLAPLNPSAVPHIRLLDAFLVDHVPRHRAAAGSGPVRKKAVVRRLPAAQPTAARPCRQVEQLADKVRKALALDKRHPALLGPLLQLLRAGVNEHPGVLHVLPKLRTEFVQAVCGSRTDAAAGEEFDRAAWGSELIDELIVSDVKRGPYDVCDCDLETLQLVLLVRSRFSKRGWRSEHKVLQSLVREAIKTRSRKVSKSQRQIAQDAECHQETVEKALLVWRRTACCRL